MTGSYPKNRRLGYVRVRTCGQAFDARLAPLMAQSCAKVYLFLRCALTHPSIVRALILIDTQATIEDQTKTPGYELMLNDWVANGLSEQTAATVAYIILGDGWDGAGAWKKKWRAMKGANLIGVFSTLVTRDDISEAISKITVPALVIHGAADVAIELHRGEAMRASQPGARPMVVVEGAGHAANLTHPAPVNEAIISFMEALDP